MQEETKGLGGNLRWQLWVENQIHIGLWPDLESNPGRIGERYGNNILLLCQSARPFKGRVIRQVQGYGGGWLPPGNIWSRSFEKKITLSYGPKTYWTY